MIIKIEAGKHALWQRGAYHSLNLALVVRLQTKQHDFYIHIQNEYAPKYKFWSNLNDIKQLYVC